MLIQITFYATSNNNLTGFYDIILPMNPKRNKRVVVALDMTRPDGLRKYAGLTRYLQSRNVHWDIRLKRSIMECTAEQVAAFHAWDIDGVIYSQPQTSEAAHEALAHLADMDNTPLVVIDPGDNAAIKRRDRNVAIIQTDPDSIGDTAAHYFLSQGSCRSYGYVPDVLDRSWSRRRGEAFAAALGRQGIECSIFHPSKIYSNDFDELCQWVKAMPRPVGLLAAYDDRALTVLEVCASEGLSIPRDVSLLSVDDDELVCKNCVPSLSSIRPDQERAGYAAGAFLSGLMRTGSGRHVKTLSVKSIIHRNSTLGVSRAGLLVQKALAYIRGNVRRGIDPGDVVAHLKVSRPLLDLRFREMLGTSVGKTIEQERLAAVCTALTHSDAKLHKIAEDCGYTSQFSLMHAFKRHFGITAAEYRRMNSAH